MKKDNDSRQIGLAVWSLALLALALLAMQAWGDSVRLHGRIAVKGPEVRLSDVAELEGDEAEALADLVVATFKGGGRELTLHLSRIKRQLDEADANFALLSLKGFERCTVTRLKTDGEAEDEQEDRPRPETVANVERTVDLQTSLTLRSLVEKVLRRYAGGQAEALRIAFRPGDEKVLDQSAVGGRLEILPLTRSRLGRVPVMIKRLEGDREVDRWTVEARVARQVLAVVATETIRHGDKFDASNTALRPIMLHRDEDALIDDPAVVRGQTCKSTMREGAIVTADQIKPPTVIRRGELVELRCIVNGLLVSQMGYAAEDAGLDEPVRIRLSSGGRREVVAATATGRRKATIKLHRSSPGRTPGRTPGPTPGNTLDGTADSGDDSTSTGASS